jgi:hypothetical protein
MFLFKLVFFSILVGLAVVVIRSIYRRIPKRAHAAVRRAIRELRLMTGSYSLAILMDRMVDQVIDSALPSVNKAYVANQVRFGLHPRDMERFGGFVDQMAAEIADLVRNRVASDRRLELRGEIAVAIVKDEAASPGRPLVTARIVREAAKPSVVERALTPHRQPVSATIPMPEPTAKTVRATYALVVVGGRGQRVVPLTGSLVIGRGNTADIQIHDEKVSREHTRLSVLDGAVSVVDLDSTNGTFVDDERVEMALLTEPALLRFGTRAQMRLVRV